MTIDEVNARIDKLLVATKVAPDRSDLKILLSLYLGMKKKLEN